MRIRASIPLLLTLCVTIAAGLGASAADSSGAIPEDPYTWQNFWYKLDTKWNERHRGHLRPYIGSRNYEAVIDDPAVRSDVERQLGDRFVELVRNISGHRSVVKFDGLYFTLEGLRLDTGKEQGILVLNISNWRVHAGISSNGQITVFSEAPSYEELPPQIRLWIHDDEVMDVIYRHPKTNFQWVK